MKIGRRSGISTLIGTVFFVLVVALVVATFAGLFTTFGTFIQNNHASNHQTVVEKESDITLSNVAFGGLLNTTSRTNVGWTNDTSPNSVVPLLPVTNMNFTEGLQGWYSSATLSTPVDAATITDANTTNSTLPGTVKFALTVTNGDPSGTAFSKVTLLVAQALTMVSVPASPSCSSTWVTSAIVGNNITWFVNPHDDGQGPGTSCTFPWSAYVNATAAETYYSSVLVTWYHTTSSPQHPTGQLIGGGAATVSTEVAQLESGKLRINGTSNTQISPVSQSLSPSGFTYGYDPSPVDASPISGAGSVFAEFQPLLSSQTITSAQQVSASNNISTSFQLTSAMAAEVASNSCCRFTMETDLNRAVAAPNPVVYFEAFLTNLKTGTTVILDPDGTNPALTNDFGLTGWTLVDFPFNPASSFWTEANYTLRVQTNMTVLGAANETAGYFPNVELHFDDVGLSLLPQPPSPTEATFYAAYEPSPWHLPTKEVQTVSIGANASEIPVGSVGYLQAQDDTSGTPRWKTLETVFFENSTSAQFYATVPPQQSSFYVNKQGDLAMRVVVVSYGESPSNNTEAIFQGYSLVTTEDVPQVIVTLADASPQPVNLTAIFVSGPDAGYQFLMGKNAWIASATTFTVQLKGFEWEPGQSYTFSVITSQGVLYSKSVTAP